LLLNLDIIDDVPFTTANTKSPPPPGAKEYAGGGAEKLGPRYGTYGALRMDKVEANSLGAGSLLQNEYPNPEQVETTYFQN